jgi:hypothetical protein
VPTTDPSEARSQRDGEDPQRQVYPGPPGEVERVDVIGDNYINPVVHQRGCPGEQHTPLMTMTAAANTVGPLADGASRRLVDISVLMDTSLACSGPQTIMIVNSEMASPELGERFRSAPASVSAVRLRTLTRARRAKIA